MKKLIISLLLLLPLQFAKGQDRIITVQNDTINCRIIAISPAHIQYEQKQAGHQVTGKFIPVEQVLTYYRSSQSQDMNPYYWPGKMASKPSRPWLIGLQAGGSFLLASTANDEKSMIDVGIPKQDAKDYYRKLTHGFHIGGEVHYLVSNVVGIGVKYSFFTSSAKKDFLMKTGDYYPSFVTIGHKEKQYINYVGPSVIFQQWLDENRKFQLSETLSAGYIHYRNESRTDLSEMVPSYSYSYGYEYPTVSTILTEGQTWGGTAGVSVAYFPVPYLSIGAGAGLMYAMPIKEVDMSDKEHTAIMELSKPDYLKLSRLDYSLNVRLHF